eukprot:31511-Pelagococcus_subviridis.AAC.2
MRFFRDELSGYRHPPRFEPFKHGPHELARDLDLIPALLHEHHGRVHRVRGLADHPSHVEIIINRQLHPRGRLLLHRVVRVRVQTEAHDQRERPLRFDRVERPRERGLVDVPSRAPGQRRAPREPLAVAAADVVLEARIPRIIAVRVRVYGRDEDRGVLPEYRRRAVPGVVVHVQNRDVHRLGAIRVPQRVMLLNHPRDHRGVVHVTVPPHPREAFALDDDVRRARDGDGGVRDELPEQAFEDRGVVVRVVVARLRVEVRAGTRDGVVPRAVVRGDERGDGVGWGRGRRRRVGRRARRASKKTASLLLGRRRPPFPSRLEIPKHASVVAVRRRAAEVRDPGRLVEVVVHVPELEVPRLGAVTNRAPAESLVPAEERA